MLVALQRWWHLPLSQDDMVTLATSLGSDVSFLSSSLALCERRGERVTSLSPHWPSSMRWLLLVKPAAINLSTAVVFHHFPLSDYTSDAHSRAVSAALTMRQTLKTKNLHNGLKREVLNRYPEVHRANEAILNAGAPVVCMSGSRPTFFAPFPDLGAAVRPVPGPGISSLKGVMKCISHVQCTRNPFIFTAPAIIIFVEWRFSSNVKRPGDN